MCSDQISTSAPAESASVNVEPDLPNPKKRAKTAATKPPAAAAANTKASRSKNPLASTILSPKSHNSRTLPRSPFKVSPEKPPAKPVAVGRAASRLQTAKKAPAPAPASSEVDGRSSGVSDSSAGTTIVNKPAAAGARSRGAPARKAVTGSKTAAVGVAAKKTTAAAVAARKENLAPAPAAAAVGGRSLRSKRA